jgi:hypothetical protein
VTRVLVLVAVMGLVGGGAALVAGLSGDDDALTLAGGLVSAGSLPWLVAALALAGHAQNREHRAKLPGRATILRAWETGPWVNEKPAIGLELEVTVDDGTFAASTKARLPNFHLQVGLLQPGVELPVLVDDAGPERAVEVDFEAWDAEHAGAAMPDRPRPEASLSRRTPEIGPHVLDGIRRPIRRVRVVIGALIATVPLVGGLSLWGDDGAVAGLVLAMVGALLLSFVVSTVVVGHREGAIWQEEPERNWPDEQGTAEVLEVWTIGDLGVKRVHGFVLRVHAGGSQWEVSLRQGVPADRVASLEPGLRVAVRATPTDQRRVAIDWAASDVVA